LVQNIMTAVEEVAQTLKQIEEYRCCMRRRLIVAASHRCRTLTNPCAQFVQMSPGRNHSLYALVQRFPTWPVVMLRCHLAIPYVLLPQRPETAIPP
jgi:hypothetical protein